jgi:hypothetical protein
MGDRSIEEELEALRARVAELEQQLEAALFRTLKPHRLMIQPKIASPVLLFQNECLEKTRANDVKRFAALRSLNS